MTTLELESTPQAGTFVPPQGAVFGTINKSLGPFSLQAQWPDDRTIGSQTQSANGSANAQYFVYWVNGVAKPYYLLLQRITGSFSPGSKLASGPHSFGFFQTGVSVSNQLSVPTATSSLVGHSPGSFESSKTSENAPVNLSIPMILLLPSGGGWSPQEFTAQEQTAIPLANWAILDQSDPGKLLQKSYFHQFSSWNPVTHAVSDWPNWYTLLFDGSDNPVAPPQFSTGTFQFEVVVAWMIEPRTASLAGPTGPLPPSIKVELTTALRQELGAWHNVAGCLSSFKGVGPYTTIDGAHHINSVVQSFDPVKWTIDLADIVKKSAG